jgi:hypothetical protein
LEVEAALAEAQVVASFAKLHEARKEDWDLDEHHCEGGETRYGREGDAAEAEDVEYAGEEHQHEELGSAVARTWSVMIRHAGGNYDAFGSAERRRWESGEVARRGAGGRARPTLGAADPTSLL